MAVSPEIEDLARRLHSGLVETLAASSPGDQAVRLAELLPETTDSNLLSDQFAASGHLIATDSASWTGWFLRGVLRSRTGKAGEAAWHDGNGEPLAAALDDLDKAVACGASFCEAFRQRALCYYRLEVPLELLENSEVLVRQRPEDGQAYYLRGVGHSGLCENEEALADFRKAEERGIDTPRLYEKWARIWSALDEKELAISTLEKSIREDPDRPWTPHELHHRAHFWDRLGLPDKANEDFHRAHQVEPKSTDFLYCWGNLLRSMDETPEVLASLDLIDRIQHGEDEMAERTLIYPLVLEHFREAPLDSLSMTDRVFPHRAVADAQRGLDTITAAGFKVECFHAAQWNDNPVKDFSTVYRRDRRNQVLAAPPQYLEIDIGEDEPVRALKFGMWLLRYEEEPLCLLTFGEYDGLHIVVSANSSPAGLAASHKLYQHLEDCIARSDCYRGKILSLEHRESYNGQALGILVHKIRHVERDEVILPRKTLDLLDRNVLDFVKHRPKLSQLGLAVKKGLLFYGPPGTGKTHTIHYLAGSLTGHTTFLISAEQVCNLSDYMTLARLLQPSVVVLEDVDLIARDRADMRSGAEETLLNKLLNEMDGLKSDSEILFVLTTNRPEALEAALASRPGRVDQAIEFPLPDPAGRTKLVSLYSQGVPLDEGATELAVARTNNVSASFIKELMRRAIQTALMRGDELRISPDDAESALQEMMVAGGSLNRKLLGASHEIGFRSSDPD